MTKTSWSEFVRQIRCHIKPDALNRTKLTSVEVPGAVSGKCHRLDSKDTVTDHLIDRNVEYFSHAVSTPFGYTVLGTELGHTRDSPMADTIHHWTLEHSALSDKAIHPIVKQL
jgi:hypothetical protein